jgi:hypothetical protein
MVSLEQSRGFRSQSLTVVAVAPAQVFDLRKKTGSGRLGPPRQCGERSRKQRDPDAQDDDGQGVGTHDCVGGGEKNADTDSEPAQQGKGQTGHAQKARPERQ